MSTARLRGFGVLLRDRLFVGSALSAGLAGASMFAYIAGSTFVLQRIYGLSAEQFSWAFGLNALGIMAAGQLGARLARRWSPPQETGRTATMRRPLDDTARSRGAVALDTAPPRIAPVPAPQTGSLARLLQ